MDESQKRGPALVSELAGDADLAELLAQFVATLGERVAAMEASLAAGDFGRTAALAHQLKGAAGGYGFPTITDAAKRLEALVRRADDAEGARAELSDLAALCARASAGPPG